MGVELTDAEAAELRQWIRELAEAGYLAWDVDDLDNWPNWTRRFRPLWDRLGASAHSSAIGRHCVNCGTSVPPGHRCSTCNKLNSGTDAD